MKRKAEEGYAQYKLNLKEGEKSMGKLNFCMRLAREMLSSEPDDVRSRVELYCKNVTHPGYEERDEFVNYPEEEQIRLANALTTRRYAFVLCTRLVVTDRYFKERRIHTTDGTSIP